MYVPSRGRIHTRNPTFVLDKYTGDGDDMEAPRWAGVLVMGEEYTIYEFLTIITGLMLKSACRMVNLEEASAYLFYSLLFPLTWFP